MGIVQPLDRAWTNRMDAIRVPAPRPDRIISNYKFLIERRIELYSNWSSCRGFLEETIYII